MPLIRQPQLRHLAIGSGFSLPEALFIVALTWLLIIVLTPRSIQAVPDQNLELATSRVAAALIKAMLKADRENSPCSISLTPDGWGQTNDSGMTSCLGEGQGQLEPGTGQNLNARLRYTNSPDPAVLTIDPDPKNPRISPVSTGGTRTIVITVDGASQQRCLALESESGLFRIGRYEGPTTGTVQLNQCTIMTEN